MRVFSKLASIREKGSNGNPECMDYRKNSSNRKVFLQIQKTSTSTTEDRQHLKVKDTE